MEEKDIEQQNSWWWQFDFIASPVKTLANKWTAGVGFAGLIVLIAVIGVTIFLIWDKITSWISSSNDVEKLRIEKTYELQLKSVDLLESKVMPKLDDILKRLENVEGRTTALETRVNKIESDLDFHRKTGK